MEDKSINNDKRKLPRHVDGRIKVGLMPIKNFFIFLPFAIGIIAVVVIYFSPLAVLIGSIIFGIFLSMFSEFNNRESGFDLIKNILKYALKGDKYFERNSINVELHKRFTRNKI